jgi:hypothetical protein
MIELPLPTLEQQEILEFIICELRNQTRQDIHLGWVQEQIMSQYGRYPELYDLEQKPESIENIVNFLKGQVNGKDCV